LGIKPLYVSRSPRGLVFCERSACRARRRGQVASDVDRAGLAGLLAYGAVQEPSTFLPRHIARAPRGGSLEFDLSGDRVGVGKELYPLAVPGAGPGDERSAVAVDELAHAARHVGEGAPESAMSRWACSCRSGLDSTIVASPGGAGTRNRLRTYTVGFCGETRT